MAENRVQEKLKHFETAMFNTATKERDEILKETETLKKKELKQAEDEVLNRAYRLIQKNIADISISNTMLVAQQETQYKQKLLQKRQEIFDNVFENVRKRLLQYTQTPEYVTFLVGIAEDFAKAYPYENSVICLRREDLKFADQLKTALGLACTVQEDDDMELGGIKIANQEHGVIADESFETRLSDQKQWFYTHTHLMIESQ